MEKRILIAFVLSAVIFAVWTAMFPPPKPAKPVAVTHEQGDTERVEARLEGEETYEANVTAEHNEAEPALGATAAGEVVSYTLENDVLNVVVTNRGAAISSIILKHFDGDEGEPLDLVQGIDHPERTLPLQLITGTSPDNRVYEGAQEGRSVILKWADGLGGSVVKTITLMDEGYGLEVAVEAGGEMGRASLSVGTGMRETGGKEQSNRFATWGDITVSADGERETFRREKTKEPKELALKQVQFVGFEDTYFLNVWRPATVVGGVTITPLKVPGIDDEGQAVEIPVLRADIDSGGGVFRGQLFPAPKEYDLLKREGGGLEKSLHFGIFHPIAVFFLKIVQWIHGWAHNWGWSIVLLTVALRLALFPLMHTSTVSMRRMQKIQPKVKAIQEKYKKNKSDPQVRGKMNQETMALYKQEGVNPMGGCLPILVQMPILFALYTLFAHAIELRHAPFIWWITDLSAKDPLYITPVLMTATMWLQQRLAPQAGDPQQMKMMRMMPLVFGIMFLGFPSGLVLYWLTNNVVSILQQEITLNLIGERRRPKILGGQRKGRK